MDVLQAGLVADALSHLQSRQGDMGVMACLAFARLGKSAEVPGHWVTVPVDGFQEAMGSQIGCGRFQ